MEIATFSNLREAQNILTLIDKHPNATDLWYFVGGINLVPKSKADWYWITTGDRVDYDIPFGIGQPDTMNGTEFCLDVNNQPQAYFNDYSCSSTQCSFICQIKKIYNRC